MSAAAEWNHSKRWNPFNSYKLLSHVETWRQIRRNKPLPPPILVTVDPANVCNYNCHWCNAAAVRAKRKTLLSRKTLLGIADMLAEWGVSAVCVAGGGEPLLNEHTGEFIERLVAGGLSVGVVTNGYLIDRFIDQLSLCTWVGVSMDAGTEETYRAAKGTPEGAFTKVQENIRRLVSYSRLRFTRLGHPHPSYGVSWKFLICPENAGEVLAAAQLAIECGCKAIHYRPVGTPWQDIGTEREIVFSQDVLLEWERQISEAIKLDGPAFGVFGVTHKFDSQFCRCNSFQTCHAVFMTGVISPPTTREHKDAFCFGLCCDRRGDPSLELLQDCDEPGRIPEEWGGLKHWEIHDRIDIQKDCPRCTYQPHNEIFEQVICRDAMTHVFI